MNSKYIQKGEWVLSSYSFYKYICRTVEEEINRNKWKISEKEKHKYEQYNMHESLKLFPYFPEIDLINDLSCENYERRGCNAKFIFLPFENSVDKYPISYSYDYRKIYLKKDKKRLIRKILESLDDKHFLIFTYNGNSYCADGVAEISDVEEYFHNYYLISISGYLRWSAKCENLDLFDYDGHEFYDFDHIKIELEKQIDNVSSRFSPDYLFTGKLKEILHIIAKQNHGTSFVIFDSEKYAISQTEHLCNSGRGFKFKNIVRYEELIKCLPQLIKIDGGLILNKNLDCYAYGCIYDGKIDGSFEGSMERGSRYNSTKLYVSSLNKEHKSLICHGIVFSDDGGVECVPDKK